MTDVPGGPVLCPVSAVRDGSSPIVSADGREYRVFELEPGRYVAVLNYCPHKGAPICLGTVRGTMLPTAPGGPFHYGLVGRILVCPWHRWEFDLESGDAAFGIDRRRLVRHAVDRRGDDLYLGARITGAAARTPGAAPGADEEDPLR